MSAPINVEVEFLVEDYDDKITLTALLTIEDGSVEEMDRQIKAITQPFDRYRTAGEAATSHDPMITYVTFRIRR